MNGEYDFEPIPGLPEELPAGETLLWQGSPDWKIFALKALHIRGVAIYFALLLGWYGLSKLAAGEAPVDMLESWVRLAFYAVVAVTLIGAYAWASARSTIYTVTSQRVVIRAGVALPMVLNLPFARIESVDLKTYRDGGGDIALTLAADDRIAYLMLWPHAQPWKLARARPMLRSLPRAAAAAQILGEAIAAAEPGSAAQAPQMDWGTPASVPSRRPPHAPALA